MAELTLPLHCDIAALPDRLSQQIIDCASGCWEWQGARTRGYGRVQWNRRNTCVHRLVWTLLVEPLTDGFVLDHLCRNHPCCNPAHLEPVTQEENARRSLANRNLPLVVPTTAGAGMAPQKPAGDWTWLLIPGYPDYEISERPDIWSIPRTTTRGGIIKQTLLPGGYMAVRIGRDGWQKTRPVHQLVAEAFLGPRPDGLEVCHNDGDRTNNALSNLRYDTRSGNHHDKRLHGTDNWGNSNACGAGHLWTDETTVVRLNRDGSFKRRQCTLCLVIWRARSAERRKTA